MAAAAVAITVGMEAEVRMGPLVLGLGMAVISERSTELTTERRSTSAPAAAVAIAPLVATAAARLTYLRVIYRSRPVLRFQLRAEAAEHTTLPVPEVLSFLTSPEPIRTQEAQSRLSAAQRVLCQVEMVEFTSRRAC